VDSEVIRPDGKTDPLIAREMLAYFNLSDRWCDATREALFESYLGCLEEEMSLARSAGLIRVLPGVSDLLEALSRQEDFAVGLVTGNLERGAHIKTGEGRPAAGYFHFGGYGSDSERPDGIDAGRDPPGRSFHCREGRRGRVCDWRHDLWISLTGARPGLG